MQSTREKQKVGYTPDVTGKVCKREENSHEMSRPHAPTLKSILYHGLNGIDEGGRRRAEEERCKDHGRDALMKGSAGSMGGSVAHGEPDAFCIDSRIDREIKRTDSILEVHRAPLREVFVEGEQRAECDQVTQGRHIRDEDSIQVRKQYRCDAPHCYRSFTERRNLAQQHRKAGHSDERPFFCIVMGCDKAFKYKCVLEKHMNSFHLDSSSMCRASENIRIGEALSSEVMTEKLQEYNAPNTNKSVLRMLQAVDRSSTMYRELLLDYLIGGRG